MWQFSGEIIDRTQIDRVDQCDIAVDVALSVLWIVRVGGLEAESRYKLKVVVCVEGAFEVECLICRQTSVKHQNEQLYVRKRRANTFCSAKMRCHCDMCG